MAKEKTAAKKITKYLEKQGVKFELVPHKKVYTAYDLAQTIGTKLDEIAKTLLVKVELPEVKKKGVFYIVVVPASYHVDLQKVKKALKAKKVELAPEKIFKKFGLEPGAVSPFGSLNDFGVLVDKGVVKAKHAIVGAESFIESLKLKVKDLVELEQAIVASVGKKNTLKLQRRSTKSKKAKVSGKKRKSFKKKVAKKVASRMKKR
ncbi:YbaK/EbsC family protein [Patescibacteria group bacterium]|nr:YbaK/EbsC family protein [Patescibacteria group bacterium]